METPKINILFLAFILCTMSLYAQSISGVVLDAKTNEPIESASVFFDNTTIGTSTDNKGSFEISVEPGIYSPLIISYLGYEKIIISNYNANKYYKILLVEEQSSLDEVYLTYFDGMSKETKLKFFREQFLGLTPNAKSCTVLNEDDLILRFNKKMKQLTVSSKRPLIIYNENLQYEIRFDIKDFIIDYKSINVDRQEFSIKSVLYTGTTFYKNLKEKDSITEVQRKTTYKGSVMHFMRSLSNESLNTEGYQIFSKSFIVEPSKYINVKPIKASDSVSVKLRLPLSVLYADEFQSEMVSINTKFQDKKINPFSLKDGDSLQVVSIKFPKKEVSNSPYFNTEIVIDGFGNYSPIGAIYFIGHMGNLRVGDTLPLDYNLEN